MCCALTSISSLQFGFRTGIFLAVMNIPCDEFSLQQQPQQVQYHPAVLNYAVFILCLLCVVKQDLRQLCPGGGGGGGGDTIVLPRFSFKLPKDLSWAQLKAHALTWLRLLFLKNNVFTDCRTQTSGESSQLLLCE